MLLTVVDRRMRAEQGGSTTDVDMAEAEDDSFSRSSDRLIFSGFWTLGRGHNIPATRMDFHFVFQFLI